jgi:hypothetical protein
MKTIHLLALAICLASLTSCAGSAFPIRASIVTPDGTVGYSSKGGLDVAVDVRGRK